MGARGRRDGIGIKESDINASNQPLAHQHLGLLYRLSQAFNSSLDLEEVLQRVMDEVIAVTRAERGFIMLKDETGLVFQTARGLNKNTIEDPAFQISRSVVERVAGQGEPVMISNARSDAHLGLRDSVLNLGLRSVLCVPLVAKGKTTGVIYVDNRLQSGMFTEKDQNLLSAIAATAAIALENARLYRVAVERGRIERELELAHKVQASLLPAEMPDIPGWDFAAHWKPAREVSGDFYDFISLEGGCYGLVIADVTDKGMPAALFMAHTCSILRASLDGASGPLDAINQANQLISMDSSYGYYVTLFFAWLDPPSGKITYVNAGHPPPLLLRAGEEQPEKLERTGIPLGIEADWPFDQETAWLQPGDLVLLYTDGLTEANNAQGAEFGLERLQELVRVNRGASAGVMLSTLMETLADFTGNTTQYDDITLVVLRRQ